MVFSIN